MKKLVITVSIALVVIVLGSLYVNSRIPKTSSNKNSASSTEQFSADFATYTVAKKTKSVEVKNGDTFDLEAYIVKKNINGNEVKMLAYNGMIPGPTIQVTQGSEIKINLKNSTDVDTTLHSHGVRLENKFDGVPDVTQRAIKPGELFTYTIKFPDEGVYWYHPHVREDYAQELGMYGNFVVKPANTQAYGPVNKDMPLFIDDISMNKNKITPFFKDSSNFTLMGRFGNIMLVNGESDLKINEVKQGEVVRLYLTNSANTRVFNITIPNAKLKLVGGDSGRYEKEVFTDEVLISPSERAIVDVYFQNPGSYTMQNKTPTKAIPLANFNVDAEKIGTTYENEFNTLRQNEDVTASINEVRSAFAKPADKEIKLSLTMMSSSNTNSNKHMMHGGQSMSNDEMTSINTDKIEWEDDMAMMNSMSTDKSLEWKLIDTQTNKENMDVDWKFKQGDKVKIKITNDPNSEHPMQHPIHFHGQRFLVVSTNGVQSQNLVWKDTLLVQNGDTIEILLDASNLGEWMAHCHIPEHMESGMMLPFKVQ